VLVNAEMALHMMHDEFEQVYDERFTTKYGFFRAYVKQVIYRYLDCGILHNGFAPFRSKRCFSAKIRLPAIPVRDGQYHSVPSTCSAIP